MFTSKEVEEKTLDKWQGMTSSDVMEWLVNHGFKKKDLVLLSEIELNTCFFNAYSQHLSNRDFTHTVDPEKYINRK